MEIRDLIKAVRKEIEYLKKNLQISFMLVFPL